MKSQNRPLHFKITFYTSLLGGNFVAVDLNIKLALLIPLALVTACGGGDSSGTSQPPVTVPTPSPSPTPSPTATATASPSYSSFSNPAAAFPVQISTVLTGYVRSGTAYTAIPSEFRQFGSSLANISVRTKDSYLISYNSEQQLFESSDFRSDYEFIGPAFRTFAKLGSVVPTGGTRNEYFTIYRADGGTTGRAFEYTTIGQWVILSYSADLSRTESRGFMFAGGARTQVEDVPTAGIRSTNGPAFGLRQKVATADNLSGTIRYSVNFATGEVSYGLTLSGTGFSIPELKGTGGLSSTRSRFNGEIAGGNYKGQITGAFNGPQAREIGLTFFLQGDDGEEIVGFAAGSPA